MSGWKVGDRVTVEWMGETVEGVLDEKLRQRRGSTAPQFWRLNLAVPNLPGRPVYDESEFLLAAQGSEPA